MPRCERVVRSAAYSCFVSDEPRQKEPVLPLQMASDFLLRSRWAQKVREGGSIRIPGMNPLVAFIVVIALVGGGVYAYRMALSPSDRCNEIEEAFDLISIAPPPILTSVPKVLQGTSVAPVLLESINSARESWTNAVKTQNRTFAQGDPDAIASLWKSWVAGQRATVLDEASC